MKIFYLYQILPVPEQIVAKMAAKSAEVDYDAYSRNVHQNFARSNGNSTDSEPENTYPSSPKRSEEPKRNKRKNFQPRCTNVNYSDNENGGEALNLSDFGDNNNLTSVRRRKTLATRKILVDTRHSPMDLSKGNESESGSESSDEFSENQGCNDTENEEMAEREGKIPSSFSIHNLSKPHMPEFSAAGLSQGQVFEMREYAVNTMRELLGIYGLTSEVAESISKQLPIAAFNSG